MKFSCSQLVCVFVAVIVLFFSDKKVNCVSNVRTVVNGSTIVLPCYPPINEINVYSWYRNKTLIGDKRGITIEPHRITQRYMYFDYGHSSYYELSIAYANIYDSATYYCSNSTGTVFQEDYVRVIGCSNCFLTPHSDENTEKVICNVNNYWASQSTNQFVFLHDINDYRPAVIQRNVFSFSIHSNELSKPDFEFELVIDRYYRIPCMLRAPLTTTQPSTIHQTTTLKQTTLTHTPRNRLSTSISTASQELSPGTSFPKHHTSLNQGTNTDNNEADNTIIIAISGSIFILILIVLIVVLRCKQTKNRQGNKDTGISSVDSKDTKEHPEARYASVDDASQRGLRESTSNEKMKDKSENQPNADHHGGMVENILYDSTDKVAEGSISRTEGPLDNALYAMPDKRKTLDRKSRSGANDGSFAADILYGNSSIISHQVQKDNQGGDQYENVEMPGSGGGGDAEEIPLYAMPDKAPQRNTLKATPKAGQTSTMSKEEVVNVDALYAEVDKTTKK